MGSAYNEYHCGAPLHNPLWGVHTNEYHCEVTLHIPLRGVHIDKYHCGAPLHIPLWGVVCSAWLLKYSNLPIEGPPIPALLSFSYQSLHLYISAFAIFFCFYSYEFFCFLLEIPYTCISYTTCTAAPSEILFE